MIKELADEDQRFDLAIVRTPYPSKCCFIRTLNISQLYNLCSLTINDILLKNRQELNAKITRNKNKKVYYLSMEFLIGKSLQNNLVNLGLEDLLREALNSLGYHLEDLYQYEKDAGLGNGGLGRLAACFFDSLASKRYPSMGYSLSMNMVYLNNHFKMDGNKNS